MSTISEFQYDVQSFLGTMLTPSGKMRATPASYLDAKRYAIDMYRKRRRELQASESDRGMFNDNEVECVELAQINGMMEVNPGPEELSSYNDMVSKILTVLEQKDKDYEVCRYFCSMVYKSNTMHQLNDDVRYRVNSYLSTVKTDSIGGTDKELAVALNYEIYAGSQCRKLVSIKKRLLKRMESIGITKFNCGR